MDGARHVVDNDPPPRRYGDLVADNAWEHARILHRLARRPGAGRLGRPRPRMEAPRPAATTPRRRARSPSRPAPRAARSPCSSTATSPRRQRDLLRGLSNASAATTPTASGPATSSTTPARISVNDASRRAGRWDDRRPPSRLGAQLAVTVGYATADGTATAGTDYTAVSGTLRSRPSRPRRWWPCRSGRRDARKHRARRNLAGRPTPPSRRAEARAGSSTRARASGSSSAPRPTASARRRRPRSSRSSALGPRRES
jgi:hypothetical protein